MKNPLLSVTLTDQLFGKLPINSSVDTIYLDPVGLYKWIDWTGYEERAEVLNRVYGMLFDEVVIGRKKIVCFWPLENSTSQNWFELLSLSHSAHVEFATVFSGFEQEVDYGLNPRLVALWQEFMVTIFNSLVEDITLNQQFDEVGVLSSSEHSFILFRAENEGLIQFGFAELNTLNPCEGGLGDSRELASYIPQFYNSFDEMLDALSSVNELSDLVPDFYDKGLEKLFFKLLLNENRPLNLIQKWLATYSLN